MIPNASNTLLSAFPLERPSMMAEAARFGAARYDRERDLPGAVPGLLAGRPDAILPKLLAAERQCEEERRTRNAAYRPARHLQILAALLAEAGALQNAAEKSKGATRSAAPKSRNTRRIRSRGTGQAAHRPASHEARLSQANASGSDALRVAI